MNYFFFFLEVSTCSGFLKAHKARAGITDAICHNWFGHIAIFLSFFFKRLLSISAIRWSSFLLNSPQNRLCERQKLNHIGNKKNDQRKNTGTTNTGISYNLWLQRECATLRAINLLTGHHGKTFKDTSLALFRFTILLPERWLVLTPMFNHGRAVFNFCHMSQIYCSWHGHSRSSKKHENLHYQKPM